MKQISNTIYDTITWLAFTMLSTRFKSIQAGILTCNKFYTLVFRYFDNLVIDIRNIYDFKTNA